MGKAARTARRAAGPKIQVGDAEHLVKLGRVCARPAPGHLWRAVGAVIDAWEQDRVVARADPDLVGALVTTDRSTELPAKCLQRFPFRSLAVSFTEPLVVETRRHTSTFPGFFVAGCSWSPVADRPAGQASGFARAASIPDADGVEVIWPSSDSDPTGPMVGVQRMTWWFEEASDEPSGSINDLIARLRTRASGPTVPDAFYNQLLPIAVLLLLYLTVAEPDFDEIPPQRLVRPQQLHRVRVANLGWRIGARLRAADTLRSDGVGSGRWTLNPHMRSAHFRRSRLATRDGEQLIVGDIHGTFGVDWHYIRHWIPPTPVNCGPEGPQPVVRTIA